MKGPGNRFQEGRFSGTVRSYDRDKLSPVHFEGNIVDDGDSAVTDLDLRDL